MNKKEGHGEGKGKVSGTSPVIWGLTTCWARWECRVGSKFLCHSKSQMAGYRGCWECP